MTAVRNQVAELCDALEELQKTLLIPKQKLRLLLIIQIINYKFLTSQVFRLSLLYQINYVSKEPQSGTIDAVTGFFLIRKVL